MKKLRTVIIVDTEVDGSTQGASVQITGDKLTRFGRERLIHELLSGQTIDRLEIR